MTDEHIPTLLAAAEDRASILHASAAWGSDEDGHLMNRLVDVIEAQAAEIERLREALKFTTLDCDNDDCEQCEVARAALAQETQP